MYQHSESLCMAGFIISHQPKTPSLGRIPYTVNSDMMQEGSLKHSYTASIRIKGAQRKQIKH